VRRVAYLGAGPDAESAWRWLTSRGDVAPRWLALGETLDDVDLLWVHATEEPPPLPRAAIRAWLDAGGRLLLTQRATVRVVALALERDGPNDVVTRTWRHEDDELWLPALRDHPAFPHVRGLAGYGPHPLFAGLGRGTYVWAPADGEPVAQATYARGRRPAAGAVVACERSYLHLNADRVVAWEYAVGAGGVLCIGAFVVPGARDPRLVPQLTALLANAVAGAAIPHATRVVPASHWPLPGRAAIRDDALAIPAPPALDGAFPGLDSDLHVESRALDDAPYSLAGRRALVTGGEQSGVIEIWMHPHRVLRELAVTIGGEQPLVRDAQIAPAVVQRHLVSRNRIVEETVTTALEHPVALLEYRSEKLGRARGLRVAAELDLAWTTDLRRMWPYDAASGGDLRWRAGPDGRTLFATNAAGAQALFATDRPVEWDLRPLPGRTAIAVRVRAALEEPLRLAVVAGGSRAELDAALAGCARQGVRGFAEHRGRHERDVREGGVRLRSPDDQLNRALEWAKVRLDGCVVDTPGVGRSVVAGYAPTRPGWGDGRPGYAWYFGRDACWTALAHLAGGDFLTPRLVLRFLGAAQDVTGKVPHEVTTSGLAHYDAADSTPLYLLLAGRYAAWTGDLAFLDGVWQRLERAYRYCLSTDTDSDGLIENAGVGHGWIETGPLSGARVTLYLASVWAAALAVLAPAAAALGRTTLAAELVERAERARSAISRRFAADDGWALGILADGSPQRHRTALTAVALLLGAVDPDRAATWFEAIDSPAFSAPWGVRLLGTNDPLYDPSGYHSGAVWPLYTGWVSLSEYVHHRAPAAFRHLCANARLPFARQIGAFDEALRGDTEVPAGMCGDQAWSAALLVLPIVEGLLGARPDALGGRLTLSPHLPPSWPACEWRGLRMGATSLDVRVRSEPDRITIGLARTGGPPVGITVAPALPDSREAGEARVDEVTVAPRVSGRAGCRHAAVTLDASGTHEVEVWLR
jgi:hypothetical protein